jgi:small subunit ribosomal protein S17
MADEEKQEETTEPTAEAPEAEETPAEEPVAEEAPAEEAEEPATEAEGESAEASDEVAVDEAEPAAPSAPEPGDTAAAGEDVDGVIPSPKQRRKAERSRHTGDAHEPRSGEQRAAERIERRKAKAVSRQRARARSRERHAGEQGQGTPPREPSPGNRKIRQGTVVSAKPDKTITVKVELTRRHPTYEKVVRQSNTVHAHDERNEAHEGDIVRVVESRPLSRLKRWRLLEIVERAR